MMNICLQAGALSAALPAGSSESESSIASKETKAARLTRQTSSESVSTVDFGSHSGSSSDSDSNASRASSRSLGSRLGNRMRQLAKQERDENSAGVRAVEWRRREIVSQGTVSATAANICDSEDEKDQPELEPVCDQPEEEPEGELEEEEVKPAGYNHQAETCRDVVNVQAWRQVGGRFTGVFNPTDSDSDGDFDFRRKAKNRAAGRIGCQRSRERPDAQDNLPPIDVAKWQQVGARFVAILAMAG